MACTWPTARLEGYEGRRFATASVARDGVLQLDQVEKELVHESFTVDTRDHEDHTFCGIMFNCECQTDLPAEYVEITSVAVRGALGPMTVWRTEHGFADRSRQSRMSGGGSSTRTDKYECEEEWTCVYRGEHDASPETFVDLLLTQPIRLSPGDGCGLYVHS